MNLTNYLAAGGTVGMFAAISTILFRMMRVEERQAKDRDHRIDSLSATLTASEERNRRCDRRVDILILACRQGGITVPEEVWL